MKRTTLSALSLIFIFSLSWWLWDPKPHALDIVQELPHLRQLYRYINRDEYNPGTLVIFDIDNTLVMPKTDLGSDQWFYAMVAHKSQEGLSEQEAINLILPLYKQIMYQIEFVPIEKQTVHVVRNLQHKNITVIALTARSLDLAFFTGEQLKNVGITFHAIEAHECPIPYGEGKPALYMDGIIFSGNYNKGEVIASWLSQIDYNPKKVIFIDDKMKNIEVVEKALHKRDYPFIGLRYSYLDDRISQFNWDTTQRELENFLQQFPESRPIPAL